MKLSPFYAWFESLISRNLELDETDFVAERLRVWQKAFPDAPTAYVAAARVYLNYARLLDKPHALHRDPPDRGKLARQFLSTAHELLAKHASVGAADPE